MTGFGQNKYMKTSSRRAIIGLVVLILNLFFSAAVNAQVDVAASKTYKFSNGNWFDGKKFKRQTFYSVKGIFTRRAPSKIDETVDLQNGFVIPPFADAHTHNLDGTFNLDQTVKAYLEEGTFYVQVLGNHATGAKAVRARFNQPSALDVSYANGMLTCTYGHPFMVYEPLELGIYSYSETYKRIDEIKKSRRDENNAYWFLDSKQDVDAKWEKILATKPDVIKIGLLDAENYNKSAASGEKSNNGLSPEVAEYVVQKAHQANLRVFAHVETANDFRLGLKIGVDGFAHAPNYGWNGRLETKPADDLTIEDIKLAARKKVFVIPTAQRIIYSVTDYDASGKGTLNRERFERVLERYKKLFNEMHQSGVRLAFGLDNFGKTVNPEILFFQENKIFDNLTTLKIAVETTPQAIFPTRKIGKLQENYEASFLVLNKNPLADFTQIKNIKMRFKQGVFIKLENEKP